MILLYLLLFIISLVLLRKHLGKGGGRSNKPPRSLTFGFFHPFCSAGGGGERVLWHMIQVLQRQKKRRDPIQIVIYTVDPPSNDYKTTLLRMVQTRFSISLSHEAISFVHLHEFRDLLLPAPRFSMLVESWNTMQLAYKALRQRVPDVWVDTTGCAFTYAVAAWFGVANILAYVHYPTISTDMLRLVFERRRTALVDPSPSAMQAMIKCVYYCLFALMYSLVGGCLCTCVLVNSTWTFNHIHLLWWYAAWRRRIRIVYPPCGSLDELGTVERPSAMQTQQYIISIGQFRPEKDHPLQIEVIQTLLQRHSQLRGKVQLVIIGSCRGQDDDERLASLRKLAETKGLDNSSIQFVVNQPYSVVQEWLQKAKVGIHTMWNEHFGIGVVEMMANGVLTVAHDSGGPKSDIIVPCNNHRTGFLASTVDEYVSAVYEALSMSDDDADEIRAAARSSSSRFTDAVFADSIETSLRDAELID